MISNNRSAILSSLHQALLAKVPVERVLTRPIDLVAFASDASCYALMPQAVVLTTCDEEIQALFSVSQRLKVPMTFRAAGTSLSGQAVTDGLLVETARYWKGISVEENGRKVRVQPGIIGGDVNRILAPYGYKIGPDPASLNACTMGGILNNNSGGMCCGTANNSYHTLESLTFILPSGTRIDTSQPDAQVQFTQKEPTLTKGLSHIRDAILGSPTLVERIRRKYRIKNTIGYSLNAFLDFEHPLDIFRNLLIGSEGTLAFISEAVLRTVPDLQVRYTGLLLFPNLHAACAAIVPLRDAGAKALEMMDRAALRSVANKPGIPESIRDLPEEASGILVEFQCANEAERGDLEKFAGEATQGLQLLIPAAFTHDSRQQAQLWKIRSGLFPSVSAMRRKGTTSILEDVAFPLPVLADAAIEMTHLFLKHQYEDAIIFGHASDGNLHFVLTPSFNDQPAIDQYARLMDDLVDMVVKKYEGTLKAEHGTGRNMAPFVETEWGSEAYAIMKQVKALVDPQGFLNPGVILNSDPNAHIVGLKKYPVIEDVVDMCIECGFCERLCPSRNLTRTPRQRIVVRRYLQRLRDTIEGKGSLVEFCGRQPQELLAELEADSQYDCLDTCAVDGLCATACPVSINTGDLTKHFRAEQHSAFAQKTATFIASHFALAEKLVRTGLKIGHLGSACLGSQNMTRLTGVMRKIVGTDFPLWLPPMPAAANKSLPRTDSQKATAVYFPSCLTRTMGRLPGEGETTVAEALVTLAARAGMPVWIPPQVEGHCCSTPFSSKGYREAHTLMVNKTVTALWEWTEQGRLPVVIDTSICTHGLKVCRPYLTAENARHFDRLVLLDSVEFAADQLLPRLTILRKESCTTFHAVCSLTEMELNSKFEKILRACSEKVLTPPSMGCCAFAGDRGWLHPELTASATTEEAREVAAFGAEGHYSSSRTCEVGMTRATGEIYRSYLYLLEWATR